MENLYIKKHIAKTKALVILAAFFIAGEASVMYASQAPTGYSGASGNTCRSCHSTYALNNAGGSVTITGLPASYVAGTAYPISVVVTHSAADRKKFGFSMKVVNSAGAVTGTLSSSNTYAVVSSSELVSKNPPTLTNANTYTFNNLTWTAPSTPGSNDQTVTFYVSGLACNGSGSSSDYVYTKTNAVPLVVTAIANLPENITTFNILGNPAHGNLILSYNVEKISNLSFALIDMNGRVVKEVKKGTVYPGPAVTAINVSTLAAGNYLLRVNSGNSVYSQKVIIE